MNINFDKNREVMIENQLRPNKITNIVILDIFNKVSKENFISENTEDLIDEVINQNNTGNQIILQN